MRQILLIAWREYKQYVLSRGFLVFLILFPVGLLAGFAALSLAERNKPTRTFVVYDQTGRYTDDIDREIDRRRLMGALAAWDMYLALNIRQDAFGEDADGEEALPAPFAPAFATDARLKAFREAGGFDAARRAVAPYLKPGAAAFEMPRPAFRRLEPPADVAAAATLEEAEALLRPYLLGERPAAGADGEAQRLFAAILIPAEFGAGEEGAPAQYWSRNLTDTALELVIDAALDAALRRDKIAAFGLSADAIDDIAALEAPLDAYRPDRAAEEAQLSVRDRIETALPAALTYMLLVIIFGVGNLLLTNTIEERSNKIVEILLSSVTANQLMMGKLVGIAAVGLTMPTIFLIGGLAASLTQAGDGEFMAAILTTLFASPLLLIYLFYFLCAYAIFAMIFLAIGAISNSLQDAQSYMGPVMLVVFAPLPFMILVFQNPNGLVASILTWIPIYTPYAVMMRAAADPPLWEILGATALMLAFAIFLMRVMGRIFRQAILQASPPKARDVWRLARGRAG